MGAVGSAVYWLLIGSGLTALVIGLAELSPTFKWEALAAVATSIGVLLALYQGYKVQESQRVISENARRRAATLFLMQCFGVRARLEATLSMVSDMVKTERYPDGYRVLIEVFRIVQHRFEHDHSDVLVHLGDAVAFRIEAATQMIRAALANHEITEPAHGRMNELGIRLVLENMLAYGASAVEQLQSALHAAALDGNDVMAYWPRVSTSVLTHDHFGPRTGAQ